MFRLMASLSLFALAACGGSKDPVKELVRDLDRYPEYSLIVDDTRIEDHSFFPDYALRFQVLTAAGQRVAGRDTMVYQERRTDWMEVGEKTFYRYDNYVGMVVASKSLDGRRTGTNQAHPPGYQYVGNSQYGFWGGGGFWQFYGQYALMRDLMGGGWRVGRGDWGTTAATGNGVARTMGRCKAGVPLLGRAARKLKRRDRNSTSVSKAAVRPLVIRPKTAWGAPRPVGDAVPRALENRGNAVDNIVHMAQTLVYLLEAFVLLFVAKQVYARVFRRVNLKDELYGRNNHAMAVAVGGYCFGICLALGGALSGPSLGWQADLIGIAQYGLLAIVLMLVAGVLCERVLLPHFDNRKEVVEDQNVGTAFVEAGMHIANGLIVLAIVQGEGPLWSGVAFWLLAQVVLVVAGLLYEWITPHSVHRELERDNAAVGLAFGGVLVGMGNIVSIAVAGDYAGWIESLKIFGMDVVFGFVALYAIHKLTDVLLAPGVRLGTEQVEEQPNVGAGLIEAFGYVGGSILIVWIF